MADREVLVQASNILMACRKNPNKHGFELIDSKTELALMKAIEDNGFFESRDICETSSLVLQPIPYVLIFGPNNTIFSYLRGENIQHYGEARLFGKHSIGLGGHITKDDAPDYIKKCIEREVMQEEAILLGACLKPILIGTLMADDKPVDTVHFGLIYKIHTNAMVKPNESSIASGRMIPIKEIMSNPNRNQMYETWSRILIGHLPAIQNFNP